MEHQTRRMDDKRVLAEQADFNADFGLTTNQEGFLKLRKAQIVGVLDFTYRELSSLAKRVEEIEALLKAEEKENKRLRRNRKKLARAFFGTRSIRHHLEDLGFYLKSI